MEIKLTAFVFGNLEQKFEARKSPKYKNKN